MDGDQADAGKEKVLAAGDHANGRSSGNVKPLVDDDADGSDREDPIMVPLVSHSEPSERRCHGTLHHYFER